MNNSEIEKLVKSGDLRQRSIDKERAKSILSFSEKTVSFIKTLELSENSANVIFKEVYESIRQLGDAKLWLMGYETLRHDISLESLKNFEVRDKIKLNKLQRFRKIRNDANYRGYPVTILQAKEILDFWENCGKEILEKIKKEANKL